MTLSPILTLCRAPAQRKIQASLRARYRTIGPPRSAAPRALSKVLERVGSDVAASEGTLFLKSVHLVIPYDLSRCQNEGLALHHRDGEPAAAVFVEEVWSATLPESAAAEGSAMAPGMGPDVNGVSLSGQPGNVAQTGTHVFGCEKTILSLHTTGLKAALNSNGDKHAAVKCCCVLISWRDAMLLM